MRSRVRSLLPAAIGMVGVGVGALIALSGQAGPSAGGCPAGQTETRPGNCQAPSQPPPSIVDYRPKSTLVTPQHPVPRAKFPVVDIHGHPGNLTAPDALRTVVAAMDSL